MEKTSKTIEKDVFRILKHSSLSQLVKGSVYRDGMRPSGADTEDVVCKFLSGLDGQQQIGVVLVHVYVPDAPSPNGEKVEDIRRVEDIESALNVVIKTIDNTEYLFEKDGTPQSYPAEGIDQHFVNLRLKYKRITF